MLEIVEVYNIDDIPSFFNVKKYDNPFYKIFVLKINSEIIGYISYFHIYERIEIEYIYVKEEYRRQGYASLLFDKIFDIATSNKCINISLEVDITNQKAINLYINKGFKIVSTREKYYGKNDAYLMIKELEV